MRPIKFSTKDLGLALLAASLALVSTGPTDPVIFIPMLIGSWMVCAYLAYHHEGGKIKRLVSVLCAAAVLGYVGYREWTTIPVTLQDIENYASSRTLAVSAGFVDPPMPNSARVIATAFWINDAGWAASCAQSLQGSTPMSGPVLLPQIDPGMHPLGGGHVFMSSMIVPFHVAKAAGSEDGLVIMLFAPQANAGFVLTPGPKKHVPQVPLKSSPFNMTEQLPSVGDRIFLYGAEEGSNPRFTPIEGRVKSRGTGNKSVIAVFSDIPYKSSYCGAPVISESKAVVGMVVGAGAPGETEIVPALFISNTAKERARN